MKFKDLPYGKPFTYKGGIYIKVEPHEYKEGKIKLFTGPDIICYEPGPESDYNAGAQLSIGPEAEIEYVVFTGIHRMEA